MSELRVGIFILLALLVLGYLVINSSGDFNPFEKKFTLKARFVSADGLHTAADVQLAGVSIGKVVDVKFLPADTPDGNRIEATLSVARLIQGQPIGEMIRTDSTAQLIATSVLGNDKMINITPGTEKGQSVSENFVLESSTAISMNQLTATGNDLLKQINKLAIPANEILNKANTGEGTLGKVVNDDALYDNLDGAVAETKETMKRLQATIDKVNSGQGSAGKLMNDPKLYDSLAKTAASLESISGDIRAGKGSAGKIINDDALYNETRAAVADLRKITEDFRAITADLRSGKGTLGKLLTDDKMYDDTRVALDRFNSTASRIDAILSDAQAGKGTLGKLITDETLYNSVNQTANNVATFTGEGTQLLKDFRANPKKYLRIKLAIF